MRRAMTVLLVDDEPDIVDAEVLLVRNALPGVSVDLETAASGDEALDVLARRRVDVIIADYRMPGMDGIQLLRRAAQVAPHATRVLVSAYPAGSEPLAESGGVTDFVLSKPFSAARFREVLQAAVTARGKPA
ncbi:MAG: response regulator [Halobacteriales archaeon]|nr:response regulator [Halobacteriales archaeon]